MQRERKRVEAYSRKIEETKKRITKKNEEEEREVERLKRSAERIIIVIAKTGKSRARTVAWRLALSSTRLADVAGEEGLKQKAQAKLRRSIEEDVKSKFEERENERYREKDKSRGTGEKKKTKKSQIQTTTPSRKSKTATTAVAFQN